MISEGLCPGCGTFPRAEKQSTGLFFAAVPPPFSSPATKYDDAKIGRRTGRLPIFGPGCGTFPRAEKQSTGLFFAAAPPPCSSPAIKYDDAKIGVRRSALRFLVRVAGLEPTVSWSQTKRDTKLR